MLAAVAAALVLVTQAAQAAQVAVAMVALTQALTAHQAQPTRVVVLVAIGLVHQPQAMAGLELSFCQFQHHVIREQLQEVQQSQPAGQAQF
jgi:hypothetical protein